MGSLLLARGLPSGRAPEQWNLEQPGQIEAVHRAYVAAGSEAVHTNTFGGSPLRLAVFGLGAECERINGRAVELARASGARFVLGDVGPTGDFLPPVGAADPAAWHASFAAQGRALVDAGVDALHVETMTDLREAEIALAALGEAAAGRPVLVSLTFVRKPRGFFTIMGNPLGASLVRLAEQGAAAVGANCTLGGADMLALVIAARAALDEAGLGVPLVAQPNAGQPELGERGVTYSQGPDELARDVAAMVDRGARLVGGCCGTEPATIAALAKRLRGAAP
jgi:5-methyltetrahydrofolate--homocysteine methyltransferase